MLALFALGCSHEGVTQRLANFAGEQLGMLLERIRLTRERKQISRQFLRTRDALANRIALQRAEGILMKRWALDLHAAKLWIANRIDPTGFFPREVSDQIAQEELSRGEAETGRRNAARTPEYQEITKASWKSRRTVEFEGGITLSEASQLFALRGETYQLIVPRI